MKIHPTQFCHINLTFFSHFKPSLVSLLIQMFKRLIFITKQTRTHVETPSNKLDRFLKEILLLYKSRLSSITKEEWNAKVQAILNEHSIVHLVRTFPLSEISEILQSLSFLDVNVAPLAEALNDRYVIPVLHEASGRESAILIWSLTKLGLDPNQIHKISTKSLEEWNTIQPKEMSMAFWAWGSLGKDFSPYARGALKQISDREEGFQFKPEQCANILMSLTRLNLSGQADFNNQAITKVLKGLQLDVTKPDSLVKMIWALGRLKYHEKENMRSLWELITRPIFLQQLTTRDICNVLHGWAMTGIDDIEIISSMAEEALCLNRIQTYTSNELVTINRFLGELKLKSVSLCDRLINALIPTSKLRQYNQKQICSILVGWAMMELQDRNAVNKVIHEALSQSRMKRYTASQIADLIWAIGCLRVRIESLYFLLCNEISKRRNIICLESTDVKKALIGFYRASYHKVGIAYFFRDLFDHWLSTGKLHEAKESDLMTIHETLSELPYVEPILIHQVMRELDRRSNVKETW